MPKPPPPRIHIQYPSPTVDAGRYPAKRTVGDLVEVEADVFRDGHDKLRAVIVQTPPGGGEARESELRAIDAHHNGVRWAGSFVVDAPGRWELDDRGLDGPLRDLARRAARASSRPASTTSRAS